MKRTPVYLAAVVVALFWAAGGRAANQPDEAIASERPYLRVPTSGQRPNSYTRLSTHLPLKEFDFSGTKPTSFLRIGGEFYPSDSRSIAGSRPNSYTRISTRRPEPLNTDDLAEYGLDRQLKVSGKLPHSYLNISSQYPTPKEN